LWLNILVPRVLKYFQGGGVSKMVFFIFSTRVLKYFQGGGVSKMGISILVPRVLKYQKKWVDKVTKEILSSNRSNICMIKRGQVIYQIKCLKAQNLIIKQNRSF